jgi:hypothetical protein
MPAVLNKQNDDLYIKIAILIAVLNLLFFGAMFMLMNYYELVGADPAYFDQGTENNVRLIDSILKIFNLSVAPWPPERISTIKYGLCLGAALVSTFLAVIIAGRKTKQESETTDPV